jgi:putative flippase GtrA
VSIVFELLGAAVAVSLLKIGRNPLETVADLPKYINSDKALMIISGILLSVIIAFVVGAAVQFFTRLIFTFKYQKNLKRFGSIWGGVVYMGIFGLCTIPALFLLAISSNFMGVKYKKLFNYISSFILMAYGLFTIFKGVLMLMGKMGHMTPMG